MHIGKRAEKSGKGQNRADKGGKGHAICEFGKKTITNLSIAINYSY